ncbi:hypothetical protein IGI04_015240 [Brassica rapa subsp. trilocularis]|uniref:Uncharacterized protein n=1 Tax=Brassica rapa subsp. trilocularis TaxID=1813537 RepID=A0ABQ7MQY5_BRACM|nr:hypothetical protein IGI04_015240 [Brassica rapa subsp. trilocularis]
MRVMVLQCALINPPSMIPTDLPHTLSVSMISTSLFIALPQIVKSIPVPQILKSKPSSWRKRRKRLRCLNGNKDKDKDREFSQALIILSETKR